MEAHHPMNATVIPTLAATPDGGGATSAHAGRRTALELQDVTVRFGGIRALTGVSMKVPSGQICGLIGPNGAGKTTLFDVVSGVRAPGEGRVFLGGDNVTSASSIIRARRGLRRTFQRVQTFGWLTVEDNLMAALEWEGGGGGMIADLLALPTRGKRERARRDRVAEVIERCNLGAVRHESAGSLPIGVARMVEFARAIVAQPQVLMMDEPTSGLDSRERDRLGEMLSDGTVGDECAVVLVEHDVTFVMEHCSNIYVLHLGELLATGTPAEIRSNSDVHAAYLGTA